MKPSELTTYLTGLIDHHITSSVMIWGAPGIGKSSVVHQVTTRHGLDFIDLRLSQLAPTDLRGLPVPKNGITSWASPEFLPTDGEGILFLDEINMAPPAMQGVAQQLILDRKVGSYCVPDGWFIWAAGNRKEDRASVFDMPTPLANRFIHLETEADIDDFRLYAFQRGFDEMLIGFIAFRQDLLHKMDANTMAWPSPRSWEMANALVKAGLDITPAVGVAAGAEYYAYREMVENIPDINAIVTKGKMPDFPDEVSLRYASVMSLTSQCDTDKKTINGFRWLVEKAMPEWVQLFATDLFPLLREKGILEEVHTKIMQDDKLRVFLTEYARLLTN